MLNITDKAKFDAIVSEAIEKVALTVSNDKLATRWVNAINKAAEMIEDQPEFMTYDEKENYLLIWNQDSNKIYSANGVCQCRAFEQNQPCKHRAAARLVRNYLGLAENKAAQLPKVATIDSIVAEMPYLPVTVTNPRRTKIGNFWV